MSISQMEKIKEQAELLAKENVEAEPTIKHVYWFPDENEVRLVEVAEDIPTSEEDEDIAPFYFAASVSDGLPAPSAIALIHIDEYRRKMKLPEGWGTWDSAEELKIAI